MTMAPTRMSDHHDPLRDDRVADAGRERHERVGGSLRPDDRVGRRELERAVDEAGGILARLARGTVLRERGHDDQGGEVDQDHPADEQEPAVGQPSATLGRGRRLGGFGDVGGLGGPVGHDLLARHACSTHRSAASCRARILHRRSGLTDYSIVSRNRLTNLMISIVPAPAPRKNPMITKSREGSQLPVDPTADQHAEQGRDQERDADLGEEGDIGPTPAGLDHGRPDKARAV